MRLAGTTTATASLAARRTWAAFLSPDVWAAAASKILGAFAAGETRLNRWDGDAILDQPPTTTLSISLSTSRRQFDAPAEATRIMFPIRRSSTWTSSRRDKNSAPTVQMDLLELTTDALSSRMLTGDDCETKSIHWRTSVEFRQISWELMSACHCESGI